MAKRIFLLIITNILVITTIGIVLSVLGVRSYITETGIDFTALLIFSAVIGFSGAFISLAISRFMAKKIMGVVVLDPNGKLTDFERQLIEKVHKLSRSAGLAVMPEVGIYNSPEVNAFATGPTRSRSLVAVSTGLLNRMDDTAVEGVLAHEVAHVANGDMITMTLLQGIVNTFVVFLSRVTAYAVSRFVKDELRGIIHFLAIIVFQILFSILGSIVVLAFSRYREYHADAGGAALAGKDKMVHALKELKKNIQLVDKEQTSMATLKISNRGGLLRLFSSHPDLDDRINRLQER